MRRSEPESHTAKFTLRPASREEAGLFHALPPKQDKALGAIGHVRMDFWRSGTEFWHTWHPGGTHHPEGVYLRSGVRWLGRGLRAA